MSGDSCGIVEPEHFEAHGRTASKSNQAANHFGLQKMMIRIVMLLTEKHKVSPSQTGNETSVIDKPCGGDIPDATV